MGIRTSAAVIGKGTAPTKSVMDIRSSMLVYRTCGARPASAAALMHMKWCVGSSVRVMIRNAFERFYTESLAQASSHSRALLLRNHGVLHGKQHFTTAQLILRFPMLLDYRIEI
jgi:hypothetical protein